MGNRCGHDREHFRLADVTTRGKGGQPQVIGIIVGYLKHSALRCKRLYTWHNMNKKSGRRRRSEIREAMAAVMEYLISKDFQIDTRRCAKKCKGYTKAPGALTIANQVSKLKNWHGTGKLSKARVEAIIREFVACGYITLSHQQRRVINGNWTASPKVITFTKKFFLELGGRKLWKTVTQASQERLNRLKARHAHLSPEKQSAKVSEYFQIGKLFSIYQVSKYPGEIPKLLAA